MTQHTNPPRREPSDPSRSSESPISSGHWYRLPGQAAPPAPQPAAEPTIQGRRSAARERVQKRRIRRQRGIPDNWVSLTIGLALLGVTVVFGIAIFWVIRAATMTGSTVATSVPGTEPTSIFYGAEGGLLHGQSMQIFPWDGEERFTILVMGADKRPDETSYRTDTMILVSLDPKTKRVGILNIPRDLHVEVPPYGFHRINEAYLLGSYEGASGGGQLAMQTIQYNFGIPVNDYLVVDFNTFVTLIDMIGGISVYVEQPINDPEYPDMNYGYDPFYLGAGWQTLDGMTALKYARSRHTSDDIDRQRRQQQVIYAVRDKIISTGQLPNLIANAPSLWAELRKGIDTSLDYDMIIELAWYLKDIPRENIITGIIDWNYVVAENWEGQAVLRPDRAKLPALMEQVFGPDYGELPQ